MFTRERHGGARIARRSRQNVTDIVGFAALVVLGLAIARAVQRRTDLLLTVANAVFEAGQALEVRATNQWNRETAGLSWNEKFYVKGSRLLAFMDRTVGRLFDLGYRIEDAALGKNHYHPFGSISAYSAASWQDDEDELAAAAYNSQYDDDPDYLYDYAD